MKHHAVRVALVLPVLHHQKPQRQHDMYGVSQKLYLLVEALVFIAYNSSMQPVGGKKLSSILHVPPRYLEPLLQSLVRARILRSIRGPRGGYMLARERRQITMDEVLMAVEQSRQEQEKDNPVHFSHANEVLVQPLFEDARHAYINELSKVTLENICDKVHHHHLQHIFMFKKPEESIRLDYSI